MKILSAVKEFQNKEILFIPRVSTIRQFVYVCASMEMWFLPGIKFALPGILKIWPKFRGNSKSISRLSETLTLYKDFPVSFSRCAKNFSFIFDSQFPTVKKSPSQYVKFLVFHIVQRIPGFCTISSPICAYVWGWGRLMFRFGTCQKSKTGGTE